MRAGAPASRLIRLREALHESPIGLGERVRRQCGALGPAHLLPLLRARLAVERAAEEENAHRFLRVAPGHGLHQVAHRSVHPELFPEFATERRLGGLDSSDLPAGKLPEACEMRPLVAPGDEIAALALDHRGDDVDEIRHGPVTTPSTRRRWE